MFIHFDAVVKATSSVVHSGVTFLAQSLNDSIELDRVVQSIVSLTISLRHILASSCIAALICKQTKANKHDQ